jgi:hypothetical protein
LAENLETLLGKFKVWVLLIRIETNEPYYKTWKALKHFGYSF